MNECESCQEAIEQWCRKEEHKADKDLVVAVFDRHVGVGVRVFTCVHVMVWLNFEFCVWW